MWPIRHAKGAHVVLRQPPIPLTSALIFRHWADGRYLFCPALARPRAAGHHGHPLVSRGCGRATRHGGRRSLPAGALRSVAPAWEPEIRATSAGVRTLVGAGSGPSTGLSRDNVTRVVAPRVVAAVDGKLTTFRRCAQHALAALEPLLGARPSPAAYPCLEETLGHPSDPIGARLVPDHPWTPHDLRRAAADEMIISLDDALTRRLGISLVCPDEADLQAERWAALVGEALGWSPAEQARQVAEYRAGLSRCRLAPPAIN
jgi:glycerol-3-phosphate dehydrogenase